MELLRENPASVRCTGGMILRWDSGNTERENCPSKEHWRSDIEMV
jgi:hypothetical protein